MFRQRLLWQAIRMFAFGHNLAVRHRRRRPHTLPEDPQPLPSHATWWAADPHWYPLGTEPRRHNRVDFFIDGQEAFKAAWQAIREAKYSVWLADWAFEPDMELVRGDDQSQIGPAQGTLGPGYRVLDLLTEAANRVDVRVLVWSGSRLFRPRAATTKRAMRQLQHANPRIHWAADAHEHLTHCHHQKAIVVDGRIAFVGGLDMTDFDADRWDTSEHRIRKGLNWHDLYLRIEGAAAADVAHNFVQRWQSVTGDDLSLPTGHDDDSAPGPGNIAVQIVRTIPRATYPFAPEGEFGIAWAYRHALRDARRFIYIENQYLWSPMIVEELEAALRRSDDPDFRIIIVLPARPNIGKQDTDVHVRRLCDNPNSKGRVAIFTPFTSYRDHGGIWRYKPIYVHAKVCIVDDFWLTIGSANLNGRGVEGDSEINAHFISREHATKLRLALWSEHLHCPAEDLAHLSIAAAVETRWRPLAAANRAIQEKRGGPLPCQILPYTPGAIAADFSAGEIEAMLLDR